MARVTLITQWFPPEPVYLWKDLAIELQKCGHSVTVITAFPNYPHGKIYDGYKQSLTHIENIDGLNVIRLPVYPDHSRSLIKRAASYASFALSVAMIGLFRIPKSDVFLCYSPPLTVGVSVACLSFVKRVPFILSIQDMWPDTLIASGMVKEGFITKFISKIAKWLYRRSKAVVVLSNGFRQHLIQLGVAPEKVKFISNWSHEENAKNIKSNEIEAKPYREALGLKVEDIVVTFAGNMGPAQGLETVIDAAELIKESTHIKFLIVGDGMSLPSLRKRVEDKGLNNVIFAGRVDYKEMEELYALSDILLIHLKKDPLFEITIPHKLLTYLSHGKPIISAVTGEVNNIIEQACSGFTCESEDAENLANIIDKCSQISDFEKTEFSKNSKLYYKKHFSKERIVEKWDQLISETITRNS